MQAELPEDDVTYVTLLKEWWPEEHRWRFNDGRTPVVRLRKALYGHPKAGGLWAAKLGKVLKEDGFTEVEGWPSMYMKTVAGSPPIIVDVYVDDLIMLGPRRELGDMLLRVRRHVDMKDPHLLLGCYHRTVETVDPKKGNCDRGRVGHDRLQ